MNKLILYALLGMTIFSTSAQAKSIFTCTVQSGKKVNLDYNVNAGTLTYQFGRTLSSPEIRLTIPVSDALGDYRTHYRTSITSIGIPNGAYTYVVTEGYGEGGSFYDLSVLKGSNTIATHECKSGIKSSLHEISELVQPAELI